MGHRDMVTGKKPSKAVEVACFTFEGELKQPAGLQMPHNHPGRGHLMLFHFFTLKVDPRAAFLRRQDQRCPNGSRGFQCYSAVLASSSLLTTWKSHSTCSGAGAAEGVFKHLWAMMNHARGKVLGSSWLLKFNEELSIMNAVRKIG